MPRCSGSSAVCRSSAARSTASATRRSRRSSSARRRSRRPSGNDCARSGPTPSPSARSSTRGCRIWRADWTRSPRGRNVGRTFDGQLPEAGFVYYEAKGSGTMSQTLEHQSEREKVESWRLHVLIEAGYPLPLAEKIAHSEADLHRAVELVLAGCTHETAAEILL